jgi:hypothetical protein
MVAVDPPTLMNFHCRPTTAGTITLTAPLMLLNIQIGVLASLADKVQSTADAFHSCRPTPYVKSHVPSIEQDDKVAEVILPTLSVVVVKVDIVALPADIVVEVKADTVALPAEREVDTTEVADIAPIVELVAESVPVPMLVAVTLVRLAVVAVTADVTTEEAETLVADIDEQVADEAEIVVDTIFVIPALVAVKAEVVIAEAVTLVADIDDEVADDITIVVMVALVAEIDDEVNVPTPNVVIVALVAETEDETTDVEFNVVIVAEVADKDDEVSEVADTAPSVELPADKVPDTLAVVNEVAPADNPLLSRTTLPSYRSQADTTPSTVFHKAKSFTPTSFSIPADIADIIPTGTIPVVAIFMKI